MRETKICKNCNWWEDGFCNFVDTTLSKNNENGVKVAACEENEGIDIWLETRPYFGCIHFKDEERV